MYNNHSSESYNIIRMFKNAPTRVLQRDVSLEQAQTHCKDPQTSYTTATGPEAVALTDEHGMWFDGYEKAGR